VFCGENRRERRRVSYGCHVPDSESAIFSIGAVGRMLDLPPATIRTWETRYGLVVPQRTTGGQRLYTREQVDELRFLKEAIGRGARPADAHRLLAERDRGEASDDALLRQLLERNGIAVDARAHLVLVEPGRAAPGSVLAVVAADRPA
jgi:DNA-binding transcriptional MerR regulator